jgi:hypothetical protein
MSPYDPKGAPTATLVENCGPDPALEALIQLLESERNRAVGDRPELVSKADPGQLWLLWFAIGATLEVCQLLGREGESARNELFQQVSGRIFPSGIHSACDPSLADPRLVDLFESAGAAAVQACIRGDERLGYYLAGLRVSADRLTPPLLN